MSIHFGAVRQVGFVVADIKKAMGHWSSVLGVGPWFYREEVGVTEFSYYGQASKLPQMSIALANSGPLQLELIQQRNDAPSLFLDSLKKSGDVAQHVAYWTENEYEAFGRKLLDSGYVEGHSGRMGVRGRFSYYVHPDLPSCIIEISELKGSVRGGESFQALAAGLQDALWMAGGVPEEHRTDSLSAAFNNLAEQEELTRRYKGLCEHYGMRASRNNPGESHENGSIEARQGSLKVSLEQSLLLRGSREFEEVAEYEQFVAETVRRLNARCARAWEVERASLRPLPARRTADFEELDARVSKFGVFSAKGVLYSVPSRLVGQRLKIRLYKDHLQAWLGGVKVFECERLHSNRGSRHPKRIDWRHMLPALKRKPGAFARWVLRDAMFPRTEYAQTWEQLRTRLPERHACRLMVDLLDLADRASVVGELAVALAVLNDQGELPDIDMLRARFAPRPAVVPSVEVLLPAASVYDQLLEAA